MTLFLYNLLLTATAVPALPLAGLMLLCRSQYRQGLSQRCGFLPLSVRQQLHRRAPFWLHAPSVGEILALRPFARALKQTFPETPLLLSAFTATGYATAQTQVPEADAVIYFPLDHPAAVTRVLRQVQPAAFFFTETEMWPNMLSTLMRRNIPTFLVSGRFSPRSASRYRWLQPLFRPLFQNLTRCCMQTGEDAARLVSAGAPSERVLVTGNFKVDNIVPHAGDQGYRILQEAGLADRPLLIAASTHPGEETVVLQAYRQLRAAVPPLLLLLAPRHPQRFPEVERRLESDGYRYDTRSRPRGARLISPEIFLLDTLGELASFYPAAAVAFVGGSLVKGPGGHSVIEPALAHTPVCFGPYMRNFAGLAETLQQEGGGCTVHDADDLCRYALPLLTDRQARHTAGARAYAVIHREQGAVDRTLTAIVDWARTRNVSWS